MPASLIRHSNFRSLLAAAALVVVMLVISACGSDGVATSPTTVPPSPTLTPSPVPVFSAPQLKYLLIEHYGDIFYCDPDFYPIARPGVEEQNAATEFPAIMADSDEYSAILAHLGFGPSPAVTDQLKLDVYREHKKLNALPLTQSGNSYTYSFRIGDTAGTVSGYLVEGTISLTGVVQENSRSESFNTCPICLASDALIDTPDGPMPVSAVTAGAAVWTLDSGGNRVLAAAVQTGFTESPEGHELVQLVLSDNRVLRASPGHPLADGRTLGALKPGDTVDGATVISAERVPYGGQRTYDILPSGTTGVYFAGGIPLASTLSSP